jgi:hypothetical protein
LKLLAHFFPGLTNYIHGFIGWAFFFSVLLSAFFIYLIFIECNLDRFNATLFSVLIVSMAPQVHRLMGHYSLSYTFYIPVMLYLLIGFLRTDGGLKYFYALLALNSVFVFVHVYYAGMSALYILLLAFTYAFANRKKIALYIKPVALLTAVAVTPFILLKVFLFFTDTVTDRPQSPWGAMDTRSTLFDIVLHPYCFTGKFVTHAWPHAGNEFHFEGEGYVGFVTIVTLLVSGILWFLYARKRPAAMAFLYPLNLFILPAVVLLLFALAFPFCLHPFEKYYVQLPDFIKQFRAPGRFNWYFYYTATLLACLLIYKLFKLLSTRYRQLAYALLGIVYVVWFAEALQMSKGQGRYFITRSFELDENQSAENFLAALHKSGKQVSNYQAIIALPYFLLGSEKLVEESDVARDAMQASLYTGLPIVGTELSRTSISQSFNEASLISGPLIKKEIINLFKNTRPLLLITHGDNLKPEEKNLLNKATFIFADKLNRYYELPLLAFKDSIAETKIYVAQRKSAFFRHKDYLSTDPTDNVVIERFEDEPQSYAVLGAGAHYSQSGENRFYSGILPNANDSALYEISYWVYTDNRRPGYPVLHITQFDSTGKEICHIESDAQYSAESYHNWVRAAVSFTLYNKRNKLLLIENDLYATFDEVMVRPKNVNVITQPDNDSSFIFNNYPIR